jgi:hypothetical protein
MTRSIFDPTGDETERGRSQFLGPDPMQHSKMPPAAIDAKDESREDDASDDVAARAKSNPDCDDIT